MSSSVVEVVPKTLADFGYGFNDGKYCDHKDENSLIDMIFISDGQLRKIDSNGELTYEGYQFEISETSTKFENQKAYEGLEIPVIAFQLF